MGRRKARWRSSTIAPSTSDAKMEDSPTLWQTSAMPKTDDIPTKKGVARARAKHKDDNSPKPDPPTLADRFHALPTELRAHIFSLLLVQPVKWDISHESTCILRRCDIDQTPRRPWVHQSDSATCVYCADPSPERWRRDVRLGLKIWTNPWRSHWGPPQLNPYLCSQCYDLFHNPQPVPRAESLPCLCARRANLSTLLVCRKWYTEAATVFYTQNTFAFEHPALFTAFFINLPSHWRSKISKLSLMAFSTHSPGDIDVDSAYTDPNIQIVPRRFLDVWPLLRKSLPFLSTLELDSRLLKHPKTVKALLRLNLRNIRQVCFVERPRQTRLLHSLWKTGAEKIWPAMACRTLIVGGFAEDVATSIKRGKVRVLRGAKGKRVMARAVEICNTPGQGIFESVLFEELEFSRTERRQVCTVGEEDDGFEEEHLGLLGLHAR